MKILQVLHDYLPAHVGGAEIHAHHLARALQARKHQVACLFGERDLARAEGTLRAGELEGVRTIERVHQREYADVHDTWIDPRADHDFARILEKEQPDVVHFHHLLGWGPRCLSIARDHGATVVMTLHDYHALCDRGTLLRPDGRICENAGEGCATCLERHPLRPLDGARDHGALSRAPGERYLEAARERRSHYRHNLAQAHCLICPSRFLARTFAHAGFASSAPIEILPPGCPGPVHKPRTRSHAGRAGAGRLRVGFVGGLYFEKGAHVLIEAFHHLVKKPVELSVHGVLEWFPEYVAGLRDRAQGLPISFHGGFEPRAVDTVFAKIDVLCVPSLWYENHPLTIQEAFRNGIPVIASDLGGMAESVQDGINGLLFPRGDARALARAIEQLLFDPLLYDRLARDRPPLWSMEKVAARVESVYAHGRAHAVSHPPRA